MNTGIELIAQERKEQIEKHGRSLRHDSEVNDSGQLVVMAELLLISEHEEGVEPSWFPDDWDENLVYKMLHKSPIEKLTIAGALIAAEIDRLQLDS